MLPGFRILFAAFVLSFSVLIFGLGAAALLRSAHEEFVGVPSWRAAQQQLAPPIDSGRPSIAMLRVEPQEPKRVEFVKPESATTDKAKIASLDTQATDKDVIAEKPASAEKTAVKEIEPDKIRKPRVKRSKVARAKKTIRHWTARAPRAVTSEEVQQQPLAANNAFPGFEAPGAAISSGTGRNRRAATDSPF